MTKKITIDDLAEMVQKGFEDTATKKDLQDLKGEMNNRFDKLENTLNNHEEKIENLSQRVKVVEEALEI